MVESSGTLDRFKLQILRALCDCKCASCNAVLCKPVYTPCGHNFCKECLETAVEGTVRTECTARRLRVRKQRKPCPVCKTELATFMDSDTFQVRRTR